MTTYCGALVLAHSISTSDNILHYYCLFLFTSAQCVGSGDTSFLMSSSENIMASSNQVFISFISTVLKSIY